MAAKICMAGLVDYLQRKRRVKRRSLFMSLFQNEAKNKVKQE